METENVIDNPDIPQWKKDLIARLRSQNNHHHHHHNHHHHHLLFRQSSNPSSHQRPRHHHQQQQQQQQYHSFGQRAGDAVARSDDAVKECPQVEGDDIDMVQEMVHERPWNGRVLEDDGTGCSGSGSDSSEDLHYGPGIVKKLKNKYLSLALRESNSRPSILHLRKATSLENLLDEDAPPVKSNNDDEVKKSQNRYHRKQARGEMKRARSVEAISRIDNNTTTNNNRQSLHEDVLIVEVDIDKKTQDKPLTHFNHHRARPKRLQPVMSEKEKPPADFVKQAKMIFERRPEQRTRKPPPTGKVAAKVDSFNNIIVKAKVEAKKKPPIKSAKPKLNFNKPAPPQDPLRHLDLKPTKKDLTSSLPSPIPDVSRVDGKWDNDSTLSETPDLILTFNSPVHKKPANTITCESFLKEEIRNTSPVLLDSPTKKITSPLLSPNRIKPASPLLSPTYYNRPASPKLPPVVPKKDKPSIPDTQMGYKPVSPTSILNISNQSTSAVFNFTDRKPKPLLNENVAESNIPLSEPLEIGVGVVPLSPSKGLTSTEIEKNLINSTMSEPKSSAVVCVNVSVEVVNSNVLPKKLKAREQSSNIAVFNFTSRKDVPDYISNDRSRTTSRPELPKPGEGGIIVLSPTSLESFIDEDEEILRSLERPPSPCDVTFINDNILIDGKSSLNQKTKRTKLKLLFVEEDPEVYEYPSESSLLLEDDTLILSSQVGHTVPNLGGSYLANYTPKTTESFQPGVTRTAQSNIPIKQGNGESEMNSDLLLEETDKPFSLGANADILF